MGLNGVSLLVFLLWFRQVYAAPYEEFLSVQNLLLQLSPAIQDVRIYDRYNQEYPHVYKLLHTLFLPEVILEPSRTVPVPIRKSHGCNSRNLFMYISSGFQTIPFPKLMVLSKDILLLLSDKALLPTRIEIEGGLNYIPTHVYIVHLSNEETYTLQTRRTGYTKVSRFYPACVLEYLVWSRGFQGIILDTKDFMGFPLLIRWIEFEYPFSKPKDFHEGCFNHVHITPWKTFRNYIFVCEMLHRHNLTITQQEGFGHSAEPSFTGVFLQGMAAGPYDFADVDFRHTTGFMVPVIPGLLDIRMLVEPLGYRILTCTIVCGMFVTAILVYGMKRVGSRGKLAVMDIFWRPLLLQGEEIKNTSNHHFYRIGLAPWLLCCLMLSELYRGRLFGYMVNPPEISAPSTFRELNATGRPLFAPGVTNMPESYPFYNPVLNCTLRISSATVGSVFKEAYLHSNRPWFKDILHNLCTCDGSNIEYDLGGRIARVLRKHHVLISSTRELQTVKRVVKTMETDADFVLSRETIIVHTYAAIARDNLHAQVNIMLQKFWSAGLYAECTKAFGVLAVSKFWSQVRSTISGTLGFRGLSDEGEPKVLGMRNVRSTLSLTGILGSISILVFLVEVLVGKIKCGRGKKIGSCTKLCVTNVPKLVQAGIAGHKKDWIVDSNQSVIVNPIDAT